MADILEEGINLYKRRDYTGALSFFMSVPEGSGADPLDVAYYLGLCYSKLERWDDAMTYLEQVVTSEESNPERVQQCRYLLAVIYCRTGRSQLADFELDALMKSGFKPASVYASFAFLSWEQGNVEHPATHGVQDGLYHLPIRKSICHRLSACTSEWGLCLWCQ
ncbi:MAG: tetratricopeptide repeat protein, partial [Treponema sp.]|nr:tetratricopeptide repeat protein [Treponema sp.]